MFDIFMFTINAVVPIVLLIFLGYALKRTGFLPDVFFKYSNKLAFRVLLPVMLFYNVYNIDNLGEIPWDVVAFAMIAIFIIFLLAMLLVRFATKDEKKKGPLVQCIMRSNFATIGIPLSEAIAGSEGVAVTSILSAFSIPLFNILSVIALSVFIKDGTEKVSIKAIVHKIIKNPLIIGVMSGLAAIAVRQLIPLNSEGEHVFTISGNLTFVYNFIYNIAKMASPFALLVLGGEFEFSAVKGMLREIVIGTVGRVVIVPLIVLPIAYVLSTYTGLIHCTPATYPALIVLFGSHAAVSSALMAGEMGNDEQLAGQLIVWTSIASIFTLFAEVFVVAGRGLISVF